MDCGIYLIVCPANKIYVGKSVMLAHRLRYHERNLRRGTHYRTNLQEAWNACEGVGFRFIVIESCLDDDYAYMISRERYWIEAYAPLGLYNVNLSAHGQRPGHRWSKEQRSSASKNAKEAFDESGYRGKERSWPLVTIGDRTQTVQAWCKEFGLTKQAVVYRVKVNGMSYEQALTKPKAQGWAGYWESKHQQKG